MNTQVKSRAAALVVIGALATVLGAAGSSRAAAPSLFASSSGTCPAGSSDGFTTTRISGSHPDPLIRVTSQAGPGSLEYDADGDAISFGGADVVWDVLVYSLGDGDLASGTVYCGSAATDVPYTVDFFDPPTTPTTFSGAITPSGGETNAVEYNTPAAAHYVADLALTQGAVTLDDGTLQQTFASSGRFDLGALDAGIYGLKLSPEDGPQVKWTLSLHALPVVLSNLAFDRLYERPTQITAAHYTLDGDVHLTARILNAAQQAVRTLASSTSVPVGQHSLTWDGLDGNGSPVPDGSYSLAVTYTDVAGNSGSGKAAIAVDGTPPTASRISPSSLPRTHGLVVQVADNLSGVKTASLAVDGRKVQTLATGQSQFTYVPSGGWRAGAHSFRVTSTDNAGNSAESDGSFTVPVPPRVYAPDCVGHPRYKPRRITLACADAGLWVSKIHWKSWTKRTAKGTGVYNWNDCKPSCVAGHMHARAGVHLTLYRVAVCKSKGFRQFTRLRVPAPKAAHVRGSIWRLSCTRR